MAGFGSVVLFLSQAQYLLMAPKPYGTASKFGDGIVPVCQLSLLNFPHEERSSVNTKIKDISYQPILSFPKWLSENSPLGGNFSSAKLASQFLGYILLPLYRGLVRSSVEYTSAL